MIMDFIIEYTDFPEERTLIYREDEFSFDMEPWDNEIDFDIAINTLSLTVVDGKIIQLAGFCGINKNMKTKYSVPQSQKGELKVLYPDKYLDKTGSHRLNEEIWHV